ncbi:asparaginase [Paenibacillus sp. M1]|uniref:Asparaginase n=1 Tax=Paenibacillus haidiansis TaxID=1574488 RepID=A0ABU7W0J9_9BACL
MDSLLVEEYRGGMLECVHRGHICVVDEKGRVVKFAGQPDYRVFTRSAAKPIQAIPGIRAGMAEKYGFSDAEIAIMAASHRAEDVHVGTLENMIGKTGLAEDDLVCAPSLPLDEDAMEHLLSQGGERRRLYHNCSGKHLGVLAYSKMSGYPLDSYSDPSHPVQREILDTLGYLADYPVEDIERAIDGCGFPVFNLPLSALATAYMKLACPDRIDDPATAKAATAITGAMNRYPQLVSGSGRLDTLLLEDGNLVAKGGFKGVYAFGMRKERLGIAFKVLDGSEEEWGMITLEILTQLGYDNEDTLNRLRSAFDPAIRNDEGWEVGFSKPAFKLESAE